MHIPVFRLLFPSCPESMDDVRECAACIARRARYVSKAAQDKRTVQALGKFLDYESLSELNRQMLFSVFEGLSLKETASLTGRSEKYVQTCLARLKGRFGVLEKRELFVAMMKWVAVEQEQREARQAG